MVVEALSHDFELARPGRCLLRLPARPWGSGTEFVAEAIKNNVLIIPGNVFSNERQPLPHLIRRRRRNLGPRA